MPNSNTLNYKHLLGFSQLNTVCGASENPDLLEDISRVSNKIGTQEAIKIIEDMVRLSNKISEQTILPSEMLY